MGKSPQNPVHYDRNTRHLDRPRGPFVWVGWRQGAHSESPSASGRRHTDVSDSWRHVPQLLSLGARGWLMGAGGECVTRTSNCWQCVQSTGAYRDTYGQNQACFGAHVCVHTWMGTHSRGQFVFDFQANDIPQTCDGRGFSSLSFSGFFWLKVAVTLLHSEKLSISMFTTPSNPWISHTLVVSRCFSCRFSLSVTPSS